MARAGVLLTPAAKVSVSYWRQWAPSALLCCANLRSRLLHMRLVRIVGGFRCGRRGVSLGFGTPTRNALPKGSRNPPTRNVPHERTAEFPYPECPHERMAEYVCRAVRKCGQNGPEALTYAQPIIPKTKPESFSARALRTDSLSSGMGSGPWRFGRTFDSGLDRFRIGRSRLRPCASWR